MTPEKRESNRQKAALWRANNAERHRTNSRAYYAANADEVRRRNQEYRDKHREEILAARRQDYVTRREVYLSRAKRWREANRDAVLEQEKQRRKARVEYRLWHGARKRAIERGLPFTIALTDIKVPDVCPVLGLKLEVAEGKVRPNSPTLDRIIPSLGYVPGNIAVISQKANTMKSDAGVAEVRALLAWMERTIADNPELL